MIHVKMAMTIVMALAVAVDVAGLIVLLEVAVDAEIFLLLGEAVFLVLATPEVVGVNCCKCAPDAK